MKIILVAAVAENGVIGVGNRLPWHLPADLKHFKAITLGKPIVMGRRTYESIGRPLPGRRNIVVSRQPELEIAGCEVAGSLEEAIAVASGSEELMVIGGAQLFADALPIATRIELTRVHAPFEGDTYLPEIDSAEWREVEIEEHAPDEKNPYAYSFVALERLE